MQQLPPWEYSASQQEMRSAVEWQIGVSVWIELLPFFEHVPRRVIALAVRAVDATFVLVFVAV